MIDISNLDKAQVLAALYNNAKPRGLGFGAAEPQDMTPEEAQEFLNQNTYFDYLKGRPLKTDLEGTSFDPSLYDRDQGGEGSAQRIIDNLRKGIETTRVDQSPSSDDSIGQTVVEQGVEMGVFKDDRYLYIKKTS